MSTFERQLVKRENSFIEAVSYSLVIYEADLEYGLEERILIPLLLGKIVTERTNRLFIGQYKMFEKAAKEVQERHNELDLTQEELIEVVDCANSLLQLLPKMEIENDQQEK